MSDRPALGLALLGLVVVVCFSELLTGDRVPVYRDLVPVVIPFRQFLADHLRQWDIPLWNPFIDLGTPFLAGLHGGALYPPNLLLLAPFPLGFDWLVLAHYLIALGGAWAWLRGRGLSVAASAAGSLTFVLGGYLVSMMNLITHLQAGAWAPWVLFVWTRHLRRPSPGAFAAVALLLAFQLLAGSPETVCMTVLLVAGWTAWAERLHPTAALRGLCVLGAAVALVAIIAAAQILPTIEYLGQSDRSRTLPLEEVAYWSLEPRSLWQIVFPQTPSLAPDAMANTFGPIFATHVPWIASLYLGLVPLCLIVTGMIRGRERWFWSACMAAAIVMALGLSAPLFPLFFRLAPFVAGKFRYPEKFWFLAHLAASVLAAEGAERLVAGDQRARRIAVAIAGCMLLVAGLPSLLATVNGDAASGLVRLLHRPDLPEGVMPLLVTDLVSKSARAVVILGVFVGTVMLGNSGVLRPSAASILVLANIAADLGSAHHDLNLSVRWAELVGNPLVFDAERLRSSGSRLFHYQTVLAQPTRLAEAAPITGLDQWQRPFGIATDLRQFALDLWRISFLDLGMIHRIGNASGFDGITRASDALLRAVLPAVSRERAIDLLALLSVDTLIGPTPLDSPLLERVTPEAREGTYVYRIRRPLPLAYVVTRLRPAPADDTALDILAGPLFAAGSEAVIDHLPGGWEDASEDASEPGTATAVVREDSRVRVVAHASRRSLVVLNDSWFPGWEAYVDGIPAEIHRTNVFVRGVAVAAGQHTIEFRYRPRSVRIGATISVVGLVLVLGFVLAGVRRPNLPR